MPINGIKRIRRQTFEPISLFELGDKGYFLDFKFGGSAMFTDEVGTSSIGDVDNLEVRHVRTLRRTDGNFSGSSQFNFRNGGIPHLQYPTSANALLSNSDIRDTFNNAPGATACLAYYNEYPNGSGGNTFVWNMFDGGFNVCLFEVYTNGAIGWNIKTPSISTGWWENQITIFDSSLDNRWVIVTGTFDGATGISNIRVDGVLRGTRTFTAGNMGASNTDHYLGGNAGGSPTTRVKVPAVFVNNRAMSLSDIEKIEKWMMQRIGI
jgi:Concanavalin A-like lectin/glucanases superfamily